MFSHKIFPEGVAPEPPRGLSMSTPAWAYRPKPPLHGLSLQKSPIKNHTILFKSDHYAKTECSPVVIDHYSLATDHYSPTCMNSFQTNQDSSSRYRQVFKSYYCLLECVKRDPIDSQTDYYSLVLISIPLTD